MTKHRLKLFLTTLVSFCFLHCVQAAAFKDYVGQVPGLEFQLVEETSDWKGRLPVGQFSTAVLEELVLKNHSVWRIRSDRPPAKPWNSELEVYELLDSQGAYGAFTAALSRLGGDGTFRFLDLGVDAVSDRNRVIFWRGHFFFSLKSRVQGNTQLSGIVRALAGAVTEANLYPSSVSQLPVRNLIRESVRFYLGRNSLLSNSSFPSSLSPLLGETSFETAFARYEPDGSALFVLSYPTPGLAKRYYGKIRPELDSLNMATGVYSKQTGPLICLFLGPQEESQRVLADVEYKARVKWIYERQPTQEDIQEQRSELVSFFGIVVTSIFFAGAAIVTALVIGLVVGLSRYGLLRRFAGLRKRAEMTKLDLD